MSTATATRGARSRANDHSIVAVDRFIQATRDSGYKGTTSAIAEIVDNSLQSGARAVELYIQKTEDPAHPLEVMVCDDGCGMDPLTLRQAMRFGGSSRFGDRGGLGRYGMGLPNSSLSQARTVTVFSWTTPAKVWCSYLDVDEVAAGEVREVPLPELVDYPFDDEETPPSGTIVWWTQCDRLDHRRASTIARKLAAGLGRKFRYFLWDGVKITINGEPVIPIDPLYLHADSAVSGAQVFGAPIEYEVRVDPSDAASGTGKVTVTFSELPIDEWAGLSNEEKRLRGVSKGAGVSVVRGGREVDYGWFFMGGKRRENYDDWWRCEIRFDPVLDEAFGITHTKQQVRPQAHLLEAIVPDLEAAARALNTRARKAHLAVKAAGQRTDAEHVIAQKDGALAPMPKRPRRRKRDKEVMTALQRLDPSLHAPAPDPDKTDYRVLVAHAPTKRRRAPYFDHAYDQGRLVVTVDPDHPFYKKLYKPLDQSEDPRDQATKARLDLLLLAMSRELAREQDARRRRTVTEFHHSVSDALATLLDGK